MTATNEPVLEKSARGFTKRATLLNNIAAWGFLMAVALMQPTILEAVIWPITTLIVGLVSVYQGVGHLDLRTFASTRFGPSATTPGAKPTGGSP